MEELLPCPFCGSPAHFGGESDSLLSSCWVYVACDKCYCAVGEGYDRYAMPDHCFSSEDEAAKAWNTRHQPQ